jgi:hypothetical protein
MSNIIQGKIKSILPMESGTSKAGKQWNKQSLVVDTGDQFNPDVCITFFGDKSDLLQHVSTGQNVTVHINVSSREFNGKWYHNIDGWKIDSDASAQVQPSDEPNDGGDLPF